MVENREHLRTNQIKFYASDKEVAKIHRRMHLQHMTNMSAYLRKMAMDGYCLSMDMTPVKELVYLLRMCSNNLNQYARVANTNGSIYQEDIKDLQRRLDQIWESTGQILEALAAIR